MKKFIINFLHFILLGLLPVYVLASDDQACLEQAEFYGNGEGPSYISSGCVDLAQGQARQEQRYKSKDGKLKIIGFLNMIIIEKKNLSINSKYLKSETEFIAGLATRLQKIQSLSYDNSQKEITVIDGLSGEKLIFSLNLTGNIAPKKVIKP